MLDTNEAIYRQYETLGISKEVLDFGTSVEKELKERFDKIDTNAEYNQLKVIAAMQKNKVSAECFQASSGYGYNDLGRDTLERVYADCFWRRRCTCKASDYLWYTCTCTCTYVKPAPGR